MEYFAKAHAGSSHSKSMPQQNGLILDPHPPLVIGMSPAKVPPLSLDQTVTLFQEYKFVGPTLEEETQYEISS